MNIDHEHFTHITGAHFSPKLCYSCCNVIQDDFYCIVDILSLYWGIPHSFFFLTSEAVIWFSFGTILLPRESCECRSPQFSHDYSLRWAHSSVWVSAFPTQYCNSNQGSLTTPWVTLGGTLAKQKVKLCYRFLEALNLNLLETLDVLRTENCDHSLFWKSEPSELFHFSLYSQE